MRIVANTVICAVLAAGLAACGPDATDLPAAVETEVPEALQSEIPAADQPGDAAPIGSPMAERTATIGLLNKRNNVSQDMEMKPGESRRLGNIIVRLSACERSAPWEMPQETGAFVQVLTLTEGQAGDDDEDWTIIFSGWLFKNSPSLNVVEDPIYDVWVKECAMTFPGEAAPTDPS